MKFQPGQSGNPGGRRAASEMKLRAREHGPGVIDMLANIAFNRSGDEKAVDRIAAGREILSRGYGTPVQHNELTGADGDAIITRVLYGWADGKAEAAATEL